MRGFGLAAQLLAAIVIVRLVGAAEYGRFVFAYTWALLFGGALSLGLSELTVRELPRFFVRKDAEATLRYLAATGATILATGAVLALGLGLVYRGWEFDFGVPWVLVALAALSHGAVLAASHTMNALQRVLFSQFVETVFRQSVYLALIAAVLLLGHGITVEQLFVLNIAVGAAAVVWIGIVAWRTLAPKIREFRADGGPPGPSPGLLGWYKGSIPMLAVTLTYMIQPELDTIMVGFLLDDESVGIYRVAARGAFIVMIAVLVSNQVLAPPLSQAIAEDDRARAQQLLTHAAFVVGVAGVGLAAVLWALSSVYLSLFGSEFSAGRSPMLILSAAHASVSLMAGSGLFLVLVHKQNLILLVTICTTFLNLGLNALLIPRMGVEGAAVATFVCVTSTGIIISAMAMRMTGYDPTILRAILRVFDVFKRKSS